MKHKCKCDCGNEHIVGGSFLRWGRTKSCGCLKKIPPNKSETREIAIYKQIFQDMSKRSRKMNKGCDIILKEFIPMVKKPCYYCGLTNSSFSTDKFSDTVVRYNGLDRIDSTKGYQKDNVVTCCKYCNMAKGTMTQQQFKEWLERAYNYYIKPQSSALDPSPDILTILGSN